VKRKVTRKGVVNVTKNVKALLAKIHDICDEEILVSAPVACRGGEANGAPAPGI